MRPLTWQSGVRVMGQARRAIYRLGILLALSSLVCLLPQAPAEAAKKKPVAELDLDDLGIDADTVGLAGSWTKVADITARPARTAGTVVKDEGEGGKQLAAYLAEQKFI